ncbi:tyrosine-protein phosphatase [Litorimonas haliclonae]|uniref:tyrosine-protein phosphatase n=1 Tax=Litorimonas haliclonae TaxID=2081977 RepID=UPI0039EEBC2F
MEDRVKPFKTILNFRDFGNYETLDGAKVVRDKLFRSAHLNSLDDSELNLIGEMEIGLVVDLRHKPERVRQPSRYPVEDEARVIAYIDPPEYKAAKTAPHEAFMERELNTPEDAHNYMMKSYSMRAGDKGFQDIFRDTLHHMADTGDAILVHCAAGKDRTGTLVALIQGLLGVPAKDIESDYLLTNEAVDVESFLEPASKAFTKRYGRTIHPDALRPMFGVKADYLTSALEQMGDLRQYAKEVLGLSDEQITKIRGHYLE